MARTEVEKVNTRARSADVLFFQAAAMLVASPIIVALEECDQELRVGAVELFKHLAGGELDREARFATTALLAEILFPDANGHPGVDLLETEEMAAAADPTAKDVLAAMDNQEAVFAQRV